MARRIGFYSIKRHANLVCKFITQFSPIIKKAFPLKDSLHLALDAAIIACAVLVDEITLVEDPGV